MSREEADLLERSARELSRVDELFHLSVAPQLATTLERQPERARLGGGRTRGECALRRSGGVHGLLGGAASERGGRDAEPVPGGGRAGGRRRGRTHRQVRRGCHYRRLQRGDRPTRPRHVTGSAGTQRAGRRTRCDVRRCSRTAPGRLVLSHLYCRLSGTCDWIEFHPCELLVRRRPVGCVAGPWGRSHSDGWVGCPDSPITVPFRRGGRCRAEASQGRPSAPRGRSR
jgi:hypothetical protein